jgi:hypothetical protein
VSPVDGNGFTGSPSAKVEPAEPNINPAANTHWMPKLRTINLPPKLSKSPQPVTP